MESRVLTRLGITRPELFPESGRVADDAPLREGNRANAVSAHIGQWIQPQTLTVFAEVPDGAVAELRNSLPSSGDRLCLREIDKLHYLRIFLIEAANDLKGKRLPARLVLSAVFDGSAPAFLDAWIALAHSEICAIFSSCPDFPASPGKALLREWLLRHASGPQTFYIGAVRTSARDIRDESRLRAAVGAFIDDKRAVAPWSEKSPKQIRDEILAFVRSRPDLPQGPRPRNPFVRPLQYLDLLRRVLLLLGPPAVLTALFFPSARAAPLVFGLITVLIVVTLGAAWFLVLRLYEWVESEPGIHVDPAKLERLLRDEDHFPQNQFTMLSLVRDSRFRRLNLRFTLWLSNLLSRHLWNKGTLTGIGTIHFARIHQIDGGRRMLFMSDFDGSWERYLFDFLEVGSFAVIPNWTNLHGCPKSRFMLWPRRDFAHRFLPFTRSDQIPSDLWYSAFPHLTVTEILRNARIREGLFHPMNEARTRAWLRLL